MLTFIILLGGAININPLSIVKGTSTTTVYVNPEINFGAPGQNFAIDIDISEVFDLYGWEVRLRWNSSLLNVTQVTEGSFLKTEGETFFTYKLNNTEGYIIIDCTLLGDVAGVNGNGTLVTVQFHIKTSGGSTLDLYRTILVSSTEQPIEHIAANGYFSTITHDLVVTTLSPFKTVVFQGYTLPINVTVWNQGIYSETFNLTVYANTIVIAQFTNLSLTAGETLNISIEWGTTGIAKGNYTLNAYIPPVLDEENIVNNNYVDGLIFISMVGDLCGGGDAPWAFIPDGKVDIIDIAMVSVHFGIYYPSSEYEPNCDVNSDYKIDILDIATVAIHFGETDP
jgi:hypothetical protein